LLQAGRGAEYEMQIKAEMAERLNDLRRLDALEER